MEKKKGAGGLWIKTDKNGKQYLSGSIEVNGDKVYFAAFPNDGKEGNQPDYKISLSEKRG